MLHLEFHLECVAILVALYSPQDFGSIFLLVSIHHFNGLLYLIVTVFNEYCGAFLQVFICCLNVCVCVLSVQYFFPFILLFGLLVLNPECLCFPIPFLYLKYLMCKYFLPVCSFPVLSVNGIGFLCHFRLQRTEQTA